VFPLEIAIEIGIEIGIGVGIGTENDPDGDSDPDYDFDLEGANVPGARPSGRPLTVHVIPFSSILAIFALLRDKFWVRGDIACRPAAARRMMRG